MDGDRQSHSERRSPFLAAAFHAPDAADALELVGSPQ